LPGPGSNPYDVLKVPRDASVEAIEDAYDRLFDRYEPQAQAGDQAAIERLNTLNAARDTLIDPRNRAALDKTLSQAQATGHRPREQWFRAQNSELRTQNSELGAPSKRDRAPGTLKPGHSAVWHR
jgi:curved DNA-binding protein CbpA